MRFFRIALLCLATCAARAADIPKKHVFHYDIDDEWHLADFESGLEKEIKSWQAEATDGGFRPYLSYWGDFLSNPVGGNEQKASWMQLLVVGGELSLDKIVGWPPGGSVVVSVTDAAGSNLSIPVGNVFTISQAYVMNSFALYDLYFKQQLLDDHLEIDLGRFSAGQFFATMPAMGMVVSGAVNGNPTSLFLNAPYHATASASWAAHAKLKNKDAYIEAGIFQASPRIGIPAYHGADFSVRPGDGVLVMAETGWTPVFAEKSPAGDGKKAVTETEPGLAGLYTFGAYYANYTFDSFQGGTVDNAYGFYAMAQQIVWRSRGDRHHHLTLWGGATYSPQENISQMPWMGFGGMVWQGLVPSRDFDEIMLSFYTGNFSSDYADARAEADAGRPTWETVLELSYVVQLTKNLQIQPDLQWIFRPGGTGDIPDALVLGFQVGVTF